MVCFNTKKKKKCYVRKQKSALHPYISENFVTLDVAKEFISASWAKITQSLHAKKIPDYLNRISPCYLFDRVVASGENQTTIYLSSGVSRVLGTELSSMGNNVRRLPFYENPAKRRADRLCELIGRGWRTEQPEGRINVILELVSEWMFTVDLG